MPWRAIFRRWLKERPVLDRIDFADVYRLIGQREYFEYVGNIVRLQRTFSSEVK